MLPQNVEASLEGRVVAVSKRTRFEVLRRDNYTCRYCRSTDGTLTVDHVTPAALGGTDDPSNLVAACRDCNFGKASTALEAEQVADVTADAVRWSNAMAEAAALMEQKADERELYIGAFLATWPNYKHVSDQMLGTVGRFYDLGLPQSVMVDAAQVAGSAWGVNDRSAYFAGICWKRVRAMQEIADRIIAGEGGE